MLICQPDSILKLKKTLYGLKQSPRSFCKYLTKAMKSYGMAVSNLDPCLFIGDKVLCITHVDDTLFWAKEEADIIELGINSMLKV